jgi:LmbE family N-acetylglucosaminyl deacetylase
MLKFYFGNGSDSEYRILCLGSHSDDIEIGCGGTILQLLDRHKNTVVHWVVFSADRTRADEARASADVFLRATQRKQIIVKDFKDGFFPYCGAEIKSYFEELKHNISPDVIFTHYRHDLHQDHRMICELTWNTWRDHLILEYEVPKYDGDFGTPNFYVELDELLCQRKVQHVLERFRSQEEKHWFSQDTLLAVLRLRGMECRASTRYAEAFYSRKIVLGDC